MSLFCANLFFKHLVTATKHRYTRGFGHVQKRAYRARETMIFVGFAHPARDLLVFNVKVWFSVRASFRGGPIYIYGHPVHRDQGFTNKIEFSFGTNYE